MFECMSCMWLMGLWPNVLQAINVSLLSVTCIWGQFSTAPIQLGISGEQLRLVEIRLCYIQHTGFFDLPNRQHSTTTTQSHSSHHCGKNRLLPRFIVHARWFVSIIRNSSFRQFPHQLLWLERS